MTILATAQLVVATTIPKVAPNMDTLPGNGIIQTMIGWVMAAALFLCIAGLAWGGGQLASASFAGNSNMREAGMKKMLIALPAAIFIVAAPTLIQIFADLGGRFK